MNREVLFTLAPVLLLLLSCTSTQEDADWPVVLWLGTSIPQGCTYPAVACENNHLECINNAVPASFLCQWSEDQGFNPLASGLSLTMSAEEKEKVFRRYVQEDSIEESMLDYWKSSSYEYLVLPYIKNVDYVVIDHGYNDNYSLERLYNDGEENIDWDTPDRTNFIGAFNFLRQLITEANPNAKIIIGGYFQNTCTTGYLQRGVWTADLLTWMARHYDLPLLDTWNHTYIPDGFAPHSQDFLASLNQRYGTSFEKVFTDEEGNITYFQQFCPDGVHPFSDPTGQSDMVLDGIFTTMLSRIAGPAADK